MAFDLTCSFSIPSFSWSDVPSSALRWAIAFNSTQLDRSLCKCSVLSRNTLSRSAYKESTFSADFIRAPAAEKHSVTLSFRSGLLITNGGVFRKSGANFLKLDIIFREESLEMPNHESVIFTRMKHKIEPNSWEEDNLKYRYLIKFFKLVRHRSFSHNSDQLITLFIAQTVVWLLYTFLSWECNSCNVMESLHIKRSEVLLNVWSMSSCVWPTGRKDTWISSNSFHLIRHSKYEKRYRFLISFVKLSTWIKNIRVRVDWLTLSERNLCIASTTWFAPAGYSSMSVYRLNLFCCLCSNRPMNLTFRELPLRGCRLLFLSWSVGAQRLTDKHHRQW